MNKALLFILMTFCLAACSMDSSQQTGMPVLPEPETSTPVLSAMVSPTAMPIFTPVPLKPPTPETIEGVIRHAEMEQRVADWVSGDLALDDSERFLDEMTGAEVGLGLFVKQPIYSMRFVFYNLGYVVVGDELGTQYIINIAGFEDSNGQRFAFPFNNGDVGNSCETMRIQILDSRWINHGDLIIYEWMTLEEFLRTNVDVVNRVNFISARYRTDAWPENKCQEMVQERIAAGGGTLLAFGDYLNEEYYSVENIPGELIKWINMVPSYFDPGIPYVSIYDASHW